MSLRPVSSSVPTRTRVVGDYRNVLAAGQAAPAPAPRAAAAPAANVRPVYTGARAAASNQGVLARLIDWIKHLFGPAPAPTPNPTPTPVDPTPPVNPTPTPGTTAGVQAFFTNTYAGTVRGMTNAQASAANKASAQADPNNPDKQLVKLIDSVGPGGTLDGAFFDIGVQDVVDAFVRAKQRGVNVRLVTENDYYHQPNSTALRPAIQQLKDAGIDVRPDDRAGLMHDKFLVANGQTVWTGSYNISDGGTYGDNNNALEIQSQQLAGIYDQEFQKMYSGDFGAGNHPQSQTVDVNGVQITPYFSPNSSDAVEAKAAIMQELSQAKKSIQFMSFSYTDKDMGNLMLQKAQAGVNVQGVFEKSQAASTYSQYHPLKDAGLDVRIDTNPALMHHKVIIVDDSTIITGSFNFSSSAQHDNDDNTVVIKNAPELVAQYKAEFARMQQLSQ